MYVVEAESAMDSPRVTASARRLNLMMEHSLPLGPLSPSKRGSPLASPVLLGKRKVMNPVPEQSVTASSPSSQLAFLSSDLTEKDLQVKKLESELAEMREVLAGCMAELVSAHQHLAEADKTIDVREKQVRTLTTSLHVCQFANSLVYSQGLATDPSRKYALLPMHTTPVRVVRACDARTYM